MFDVRKKVLVYKLRLWVREGNTYIIVLHMHMCWLWLFTGKYIRQPSFTCNTGWQLKGNTRKAHKGFILGPV